MKLLADPVPSAPSGNGVGRDAGNASRLLERERFLVLVQLGSAPAMTTPTKAMALRVRMIAAGKVMADPPIFSTSRASEEIAGERC
jgi:hypothetical protein